VRVAFTVGTGGEAPLVPGVDPDKPETWTLVPDQLEGEAGASPPGAATPGPDRPETPDGPMDPKNPPKAPPKNPPKKR
jgi:hypothetical protein